MKFKSLKFNLIHSWVVILVFITLVFLLEEKIKSDAESWNEPYIALFLSVFICVLFGISLAVEQFLTEKNKKGKWKINKFKLLFMSLPALVISLYPFIYYLVGVSIFPRFLEELFIGGNTRLVTIFFSIMVGNSILSSFYKVKLVEVDN